QAADLVLTSVAEKIRAAALADKDLREMAGEEFHSYLKVEKAELPQIDTLGVLDAEGRRLANSRGWPITDIDLSSREYFQALKTNPKQPLIISKPVRGTSTGAWVVVVARPVLSREGELLGVV